jgi:hypothetical protein
MCIRLLKQFLQTANRMQKLKSRHPINFVCYFKYYGLRRVDRKLYWINKLFEYLIRFPVLRLNHHTTFSHTE